MLKLQDLLQLKEHKRKYRLKKDTLFYILILIGYVLLFLFWDKLAPESFFTSIYWRGF